MNDIHDVLTERGNRYGEFRHHAQISQTIKDAMEETPRWVFLRTHQQEALQMIAHKIARILNGDPDYVDSWVDIVGYAQLVVDILEEDQRGKNG